MTESKNTVMTRMALAYSKWKEGWAQRDPTKISDDRRFKLSDGREVKIEFYNGYSGWFYGASINGELVKSGGFSAGSCPNFELAEYLIRNQLEPEQQNPQQEQGLVRRLFGLLRRTV